MAVEWEECYGRLKREEDDYERMHRRRMNGCNDVRFDTRLGKYVYVGEQPKKVIYGPYKKRPPVYTPIFERNKEKLKDLFMTRQSFCCFCVRYKIDPDKYNIDDIIALRKDRLRMVMFEDEVEEM